MEIFQHRISWEASVAYPLLERGYLAIGFSDFSTPECLLEFSSAENPSDAIKQWMQNEWGEIIKSRFSLGTFLSMKKGDMVIVPKAKVFDVFEIKDDQAKCVGDLDVNGLIDWKGAISWESLLSHY